MIFKQSGAIIALFLALALPAPNAGAADPASDSFDAALTVYAERNYSQSVKLLMSLAKKNYAPAQAQLAYMYEYGIGVRKDAGEAAKLYKKLMSSYTAKAATGMLQPSIKWVNCITAARAFGERS